MNRDKGLINKRRLIPSTSMLIAFSAAAKSTSFTIAAKELNLTQSAVSRQIHALEAHLDIELFKRTRKTVELTEAGKLYAREIDTALQMVCDASLKVMTSSFQTSLNLAILPTFGTRWLMPRFPSFLKANPDVTINFVSKLSPFSFHQENIDAAIHYGLPDWPNASYTFLMGEVIVPVCSPKLIKEHALKSPKQLSKVPLLHISSRQDAWSEWFTSNELSPPNEQGIVFEQFSTMARAAIAGLGIGLMPQFLIENELEEKELVIAVNSPIKSQYAYYLITPKDKAEHPPVIAFKEWLLKIIN